MIFHSSYKTSRVRKFTLSSQRRTLEICIKLSIGELLIMEIFAILFFCEYLGGQIFLEQSRNFRLNS